MAKLLVSLAGVVALASLAGCKDYEPAWWNWFDPSKPLRRPTQTTISPIFSQVGPADQTTELLPNAELPKAEDLRYTEEDYVIGPTDVINISVLDLLQEGLETVLQRQVSHSGFISLPLLERRVKAAGLTQQQLVEAIKRAYQPDILRDPTVSITVAVPRQNTFSILGAVTRPGTYNIFRRKFTLLEALALAGDVTQMNIEWVYVIRPREPEPSSEPAPIEPEPAELPPLPTIPPATVPATQPSPPATVPKGGLEEELRELEKSIPGAVDLSALLGPAVADQPRILLSAQGGEVVAAETTTLPAGSTKSAPAYKWMYVDGRWIRVSAAQAAPEAREPAKEPIVPLPPKEPEPADREEDPYGWMKYDMSDLSRLIAINLEKLKSGDPRMNIIIRDNDIVHVPNLAVGEFYVMGEVSRPGAYSLTGRRVTAKQAVAAAGNLGALSWPNNSILIRRIGRDQEQIQQLRLQDIMSGKEPDIFLKANDIIAVGSYWAAPFLAVWRNAFRMTYGFGFIYDRNYSVSDFEIPIFFPAKGGR